jgi:hypothetical protein
MPWEAILPLLLAASAPGDPRQALMNEIEASVRLPKGARPLSAYGRYYTYLKPGKVLAIYVIPSPPPRLDQGCEVSTKDVDFRPCTKAEIKESYDRLAAQVALELPAGKRRWMDRAYDIPDISDGGCRQVTIEYSISSKRFLILQCNGLA